MVDVPPDKRAKQVVIGLSDAGSILEIRALSLSDARASLPRSRLPPVRDARQAPRGPLHGAQPEQAAASRQQTAGRGAQSVFPISSADF